MDDIRDHIREKAIGEGFTIGPTDYLRFDYTFAMTSWRSDWDNPIKRITDAISEGLKFNDNRIVGACVNKIVVGEGNEYIDLIITTVPEQDVPSPIGFKRPRGGAQWVG